MEVNCKLEMKLETEMEMQPLCCRPRKICMLLDFVPRHPRALPASMQLLIACFASLASIIPRPLLPPVFLYWQTLGATMIGNKDIVPGVCVK